MVSIKISESVKATPEKIFSFVSDFEKAPQYSNYWKSVKLLNRETNSATYETVAEAEGRKIVSVTKITSQPNERMDMKRLMGTEREQSRLSDFKASQAARKSPSKDTSCSPASRRS